MEDEGYDDLRVLLIMINPSIFYNIQILIISFILQ